MVTVVGGQSRKLLVVRGRTDKTLTVRPLIPCHDADLIRKQSVRLKAPDLESRRAGRLQSGEEVTPIVAFLLAGIRAADVL